MGRAFTVLVAALIAATLAACGGEASPTGAEDSAEERSADEGEGDAGAPAPEEADPEAFADADPEDVEVIREWTDALRGGNVEEAASYFSIPSVAQNGAILIRIGSEDDARAFNRSLPCGAILVGAESAGEFTTATFELTERPGPGSCGAGIGQEASTAFVIRDGKIAEWRRVSTGGQPPSGDTV